MRAKAEWLLLPLFLLPFVAVGALAAVFARTHDAELRALRRDAPASIARWLTPPGGTAAWMPDALVRAYGPGGSALGDEAAYVEARHPRGTPRVRLGRSALGSTPWRFADALPAGPPAAVLADATIRLDLATGTPAGALDSVDDATRTLEALLDAPDLARLRDAALPAATKAYLLRRWEQEGRAPPGHQDARVFVEAVRTWETALGARARPLAPGTYELGDLLLVTTGAGAPVLLPKGPQGLPVEVLTETTADGEELRLHWVFPPDAPTGTHEIWRGRIEAPLAGTFVLSAPRGTAWWQAAPVRRWGPLVVAVALACLVLPSLLLVAMRRRRKLDAARVRFVNEMAHDLRTPLASLRLQADLLAQGKGKPGREGTYVDRIARETARLGSLLENLLDVSRLEREDRGWDLGDVAVRAVVDDVLGALEVLAPERRADVQVEGDAAVGVLADRTALTRILANLLDNAVKFTAAGTPIRIVWRRDDARVVVQVADEGPGIPAAERGRVFARYARGERARKDGLPGSGLGLALVRELARGMGGDARLRDTPKGATFEVALPAARHAVGARGEEKGRA